MPIPDGTSANSDAGNMQTPTALAPASDAGNMNDPNG